MRQDNRIAYNFSKRPLRQVRLLFYRIPFDPTSCGVLRGRGPKKCFLGPLALRGLPPSWRPDTPLMPANKGSGKGRVREGKTPFITYLSPRRPGGGSREFCENEVFTKFRCAAYRLPGGQIHLSSPPIRVQERGEYGRGKRLLSHTSHPAVLAGIQGNFAKTRFSQNSAARLTAFLAARYTSHPRQ